MLVEKNARRGERKRGKEGGRGTEIIFITLVFLSYLDSEVLVNRDYILSI